MINVLVCLDFIMEEGINRKFVVRLKEHVKDVEQNKKVSFSRLTRKEFLTEINKSAITDHVNKDNHEIDWEGAVIVESD